MSIGAMMGGFSKIAKAVEPFVNVAGMMAGPVGPLVSNAAFKGVEATTGGIASAAQNENKKPDEKLFSGISF